MSADILTQLQTTYTQLLTQFFSTISYLSQRHPVIAPAAVPGDPYTNPPLLIQPGSPTTPSGSKHLSVEPGPEDTDPQRQPFPLRPVSPDTFSTAQQELAEDLVLKAQQIQYLIDRLPGLGKGEEEQAEEIRKLVGQVEEMEKIRRTKRKEMRRLVDRLEDVVGGMSKSISYDKVNRDSGGVAS